MRNQIGKNEVYRRSNFRRGSMSGDCSYPQRRVALVEDTPREGVRGPQRGVCSPTDMDPESRSHRGAQSQQPQLLAVTKSVRRYGKTSIVSYCIT